MPYRVTLIPGDGIGKDVTTAARRVLEATGVPIEWDATQAVVEAYATGKAANVALYSADTAYHSGKYFVSSDTGDWNADGRPTLTVVWGD